MAGGALLVVLILLFAVVGPFLLYGAVNSEAENRSTMDRSEAERKVKRRPSWEDGRE